ncbi:MAG: hypothetical protein R2783_05170 [Gelidibacter sp.]
MTTSSTKPPVWFWIVSVLALLWNLMGVVAYLTMAFATDEMVAKMPPEQQEAFLIKYPAWVTAAFAIAVFSGFLACIALLIRKKWAYTAFIISALAAIAQHIYIFSNIDVPSYVMPVMVIVVCILLIFFSRHAIVKHWIK